MGKIDEAVWVGWRSRAELEKKAARKTDADLAAEVSELVGHEIGRALVNHWFRGRRDPSLKEFVALCTALGADPGHILLNVRVTYKTIPEGSEAAPALHSRAPSPDYLQKSANRLRASKGRRKPKVRQ